MTNSAHGAIVTGRYGASRGASCADPARIEEGP
jgi:hypothetical protein